MVLKTLKNHLDIIKNEEILDSIRNKAPIFFLTYGNVELIDIYNNKYLFKKENEKIYTGILDIETVEVTDISDTYIIYSRSNNYINNKYGMIIYKIGKISYMMLVDIFNKSHFCIKNTASNNKAYIKDTNFHRENIAKFIALEDNKLAVFNSSYRHLDIINLDKKSLVKGIKYDINIDERLDTGRTGIIKVLNEGGFLSYSTYNEVCNRYEIMEHKILGL